MYVLILFWIYNKYKQGNSYKYHRKGYWRANEKKRRYILLKQLEVFWALIVFLQKCENFTQAIEFEVPLLLTPQLWEIRECIWASILKSWQLKHPCCHHFFICLAIFLFVIPQYEVMNSSNYWFLLTNVQIITGSEDRTARIWGIIFFFVSVTKAELSAWNILLLFFCKLFDSLNIFMQLFG